MGNVTKANPVGIDVYIERLKDAIYEEFKSEFGLSDDDWNSYGRIYRLFDNEGKEYLPYPFANIAGVVGSVEYDNPPFFEDTIKINSFFDILETQKVDAASQSSCNVVFYMFADLVKLFPDEFDRVDEMLSNKIVSFVQSSFGFQLLSKRIGIKTIMKDWSGYTKEKMMQTDMQPFYAFALEFEISEYYICYSNSTTGQYIQPAVNKIPYTRYNPKGIDYWIQLAQIRLYNFILTQFDGHLGNNFGIVGVDDYNCFGRVYRNYSNIGGDKKYIPQAFVKLASTGNFDYVNVLFEDTVFMQSFFDVGEVIKESTALLSYVDISLYIFVDLTKFYPLATKRMDEEFIVMISQFIMENSGFELHLIQRGIKSIMNEFSGDMIKRNSQANMQPFLCFRMDMKKYYDESVEYCSPLIPERDYQFDPSQFDPQQFS